MERRRAAAASRLAARSVLGMNTCDDMEVTVSSEILLVEKSEGIATLTLNRPEAMNALSQALRLALVGAFRALRDDPDAGVVILTGTGRAFCAGLDLRELTQAPPANPDPIVGPDSVVATMAACGKPIIGAINGAAITGGFELALACDILVASTAARFADTHARVGALPGWGMSQKLSRAIGLYRTRELSFTGNFISAAKAETWGFVNRVVEPEELMPACRQLAREILSCVPEMLRRYKQLIEEGYTMTLAEGLALELKALETQAVSPEDMAARRADVQARGRSQAKDGSGR
jgi:enoyl-CoA hydratase